MKSHKLASEYSAVHVRYTKDNSPDRTYNPPKKYVKGKVRDLEVWWGRMDCSGSNDQFVIDIYPRLSSSTFAEMCGYATLTKKELGSITPQYGDALWLWGWNEERVGKGIIQRLHIEVESRILTEEERQECRELAEKLQREMKHG
jgi:hypothetical protein